MGVSILMPFDMRFHKFVHVLCRTGHAKFVDIHYEHCAVLRVNV